MNVLARLARALGYFTIIPMGRGVEGPPEPEDVALLPLVGALVGAASGSLAYAASIVLPRRVAAAIAYAGPIVLTGALHLDGFLDLCDGMFAPVDLERRREIVRDPRHGSFAFAGGSIAAITSYAALAEIEPGRWPRAIALAESAARLAALIAARSVEANGRGTSGRAFARKPAIAPMIAASATLLALAFRDRGTALAIAGASITILTVPVARTISHRFDGELSGDAYGFIIVVASTAMLVAIAAD